MKALLVSLPWAPLNPSIQLGLLAEVARETLEDHAAAETRHAALPFVAALGADLYELLATDATGTRLGNAVALRYLTGDPRPLRDLLLPPEREALARLGVDDDGLAYVEQTVMGGLHAVAGELVATLEPGDVLGCSTVFNQLFPSLAVSAAVASQVPGLRVVFGGAEVQGDAAPAVLARFPWVDAVVRGRGERPFAALLTAWRDGVDPAGTTGLVVRGPDGAPIDGGLERAPAPFGPPDYDEFFETWRELRLPPGLLAGVPVEASQGCSWGRCDFCGTDELVGDYKVCPAPRLGAELQRVVERYETMHVVFTDEALPAAVIRRAIDGLGDDGDGTADWRAHVAIGGQGRADIRREHLAQLADRGLALLQLGVESFSTELLRRMDKGVTGLQNVRCLRWCLELGVEVDYNLILGHPEYDDDTLNAMTALFPRLHHLPPPCSSAFFVNRYSPLYRSGRLAELGHTARPSELTCADLYPELLADFPFVALVLDEPPVTPAGVRLSEAIAAWNEAHRPGLLRYLPFPNGLEIVDGRGGRTRRMKLRGTMARALLACDDIIARAELPAALPDEPAERVTAAALRLLEMGLLIEEEGLLLNVVPRHRGRVGWAGRGGE